MPNFNNANPRELEQYMRELKHKERNKLREVIMQLLILVIGVVGLSFVLQGNDSESSDINNYQDTVLEVQSSKEIPQATLAQTSSTLFQLPKKKTSLNIQGQQETYQPIKFTVNGFDKKAKYYIDYGDGEVERLRQRSIEYVYGRSGFYTVEVFAVYKKEKALVAKKEIAIADSPEMIEDIIAIDY